MGATEDDFPDVRPKLLDRRNDFCENIRELVVGGRDPAGRGFVHPDLSSTRKLIASSTCSSNTASRPSRSAIVRATLITRCAPRALNFSFSSAASTALRAGGSRRQL